MAFYSGEYEDMSSSYTMLKGMSGNQFMDLFKKTIQKKGFLVQDYSKITRIKNIIKVNKENGTSGGFLLYYSGSERQNWWNYSHNGINAMRHNKEGLIPLVVCGLRKGDKMVYYVYKIVGEGKDRCICNLNTIGKPICDKDCLEAVKADSDGMNYRFDDIESIFKTAENMI